MALAAKRVYALIKLALARPGSHAVLVEAFDQVEVVVAVRVGDGPL